MSSPLSIGDCHLLIQGLYKGTNLLRGEAVDGFKKYKAIYHQLTGMADFLYSFLKRHGEWRQSVFAAEVEQIQRLLKQFFSSIKHLKPQLGKGRRRKSLFGAMTKIRWPSYSETFRQLHSDLMGQFQMIDWKMRYISDQPVSDSTRANKILKNGFVLEDAHGRSFCIGFVSVSSWACLHEFLLQEFPKNKPGKEAIVNQRYLIHKADSDIDILPGRPTKSFSETVKLRNRIEISIIFPHEECPNCDLLLRYKDSRDNTIDPLTEIVLQDIESSGKRPFVENFTAQTNHQDDCSCPRRRGACITLQELQCRIISRVQGFVSSRPVSPGRQKSQIWDFSRVTSCRAQWPDVILHKKHQKAFKELHDSIAGNKRAIEWLEAEDVPFLKVAQFIKSRAGDGRLVEGQLRFLKPMVQGFRCREPHLQNLEEYARVLSRYRRCVHEEMVQFEAPSLEIRCLLWICGNILNIEADILHSCSVLLNHWSVPEGHRREPAPLFFKLFSLPHMVLLLPVWRLTIDVAEDAIELFDKKKPMHLPYGIRVMIVRSSSLSIQFYLDDHLGNFFSAYGLSMPLCQDWMEAVIKSRGLELESASVYKDLRRIIAEG
ncbi:hypothetical protein B0J13DRAFT_533936 [Dactylonectria estremocensis]|uniref:Ubiquitin-like domain-containing protein n=1 Tax=Dactylonectria estremocensis TaxID=1079267 RepID=A0A9P9D5L1_9HYPO|nr:hypothetical protein B0J13DRAFT_533936 [Dactylonectria estremocensis]